MRRSGNPEDAAFVRDTRTQLGMAQPQFAEALGMSQSGVSHLENCWTPLSDVLRREIERFVARRQALEILNDQDGWNRGVAPCVTATRLVDEDAEAMMKHVERCPVCLARAALHLPA